MKSRTLKHSKQPKSIANRKAPSAHPPTSMKSASGQPALGVNRRARFDLKPARSIKPHRSGTARALVVDLLGKGTTLPRVMLLTGWTYRQAVEGIRLVNKQLGYGIKEDEEGQILLQKPK